MTDTHGASHVHHAIDYVEITAKDVAEAKRFYGAAFGWSFNDYGPEYAGIKGTEREVGGLCKGTTASGGGGPLVILYSRALEETVKRITEAGGRILRSPYAFPGGRRFHFSDPSGNELAVWSET